MGPDGEPSGGLVLHQFDSGESYITHSKMRVNAGFDIKGAKCV